MTGQAAMNRRSFTWDDYRSWDDRRRWEIVGGEAYDMTPAPTTRHQSALVELTSQFQTYFRGKKCRAFVAPTDVKLSDENVVQPDLIVVCDRDKIKPTHIAGAPTLIVEVLSPATALHDRMRKMPLYAKAGVREVWLVTPYPWLVEVFTLEGIRYQLQGIYSKKDTLRSATFQKLKINLSKVFDFPLEPGEKIAMVKESRPPYGRRRA